MEWERNLKILHICPTFGNPTCGIARYSERLYSGIKARYEHVSQQVYVGGLEQSHCTILQRMPDLVHLQLEYGFCSPERLTILGEYCFKHKLPFFITYHSLAPVGHNIAADFPTTHRLTHAPEEIHRRYLDKAFQVISPVPKIPMQRCAYQNPTWKDAYFFFGQAHPHKNLFPLIHWFESHSNKKLVIVASKGVTETNVYWQKCKNLADKLDNVLWIDDYLEESEVLWIANQCAAVILPYQEYGTVGISAAVKLFLNLDIPILTTSASHFSDVPDSVVTKRDSLEELLHLYVSGNINPDRAIYRDAHSEDRFVDQHIGLYTVCLT